MVSASPEDHAAEGPSVGIGMLGMTETTAYEAYQPDPHDLDRKRRPGPPVFIGTEPMRWAPEVPGLVSTKREVVRCKCTDGVKRDLVLVSFLLGLHDDPDPEMCSDCSYECQTAAAAVADLLRERFGLLVLDETIEARDDSAERHPIHRHQVKVVADLDTVKALVDNGSDLWTTRLLVAIGEQFGTQAR
jgi:hypothetical protein